MVTIAKITSKGQVTLPKDVRENLGVATGDRIDFVRLHDGRYVIMPKTGSIKSLKGIFSDPCRPVVTLEEMQEAIVEGALGK